MPYFILDKFKLNNQLLIFIAKKYPNYYIAENLDGTVSENGKYTIDGRITKYFK